jgi:hydrogenase maturation protease
MKMGHTTIVLGLGNLLFSDEGFGIHALNALKSRAGQFDPQLEWVDGGVLGLNLLPLVESAERLLVLDAADAGCKPGTLIELDRDEIPLFAGINLSEHQIGFQQVLGLAYLRGRLPQRLRLVGVQPGSLATSLELSPAVAAALPSVLERAAQVLQDWAD